MVQVADDNNDNPAPVLQIDPRVRQDDNNASRQPAYRKDYNRGYYLKNSPTPLKEYKSIFGYLNPISPAMAGIAYNPNTVAQNTNGQNWLTALMQRLSQVGSQGQPNEGAGMGPTTPNAVPGNNAGALSSTNVWGLPGSPSGPAIWPANGAGVPLPRPSPAMNAPLTASGAGAPMNIMPPGNPGTGQGVPLAGLTPPPPGGTALYGATPPGANFTPPTTSSQNLLAQFAKLLQGNAAAYGGPASQQTGVGPY